MNKKSIDIAIALPIPLPNITTLATRRWTACPSTQSTNSSSPNSNLAGPAWTSVPWEWWHATKKRLTWGGRRKSMALLESKRQSSIYIICGFSVYPESKLWHISCSCILPPFTDKSPRVTALAHTYILDHLAAFHKQASKKKSATETLRLQYEKATRNWTPKCLLYQNKIRKKGHIQVFLTSAWLYHLTIFAVEVCWRIKKASGF